MHGQVDMLGSMDDPERAQVLTGPNRFALSWYEALHAQDAAATWAGLSDSFRLALVQSILMGNLHLIPAGADRDAIAEGVAYRNISLAREVRAVALAQLLRACGEIPPQQFVLGTRPRVLAPGLEVVRLVVAHDVTQDSDGSYTFDDGSQARGLGIIIEGVSPETWGVAGLGEYVYHPGWPPISQRVSNAATE